MAQARFVECGEILQREFAKGFSIHRFVPVLAVNGERLVVMALEKQGVGEVHLDEDQIVPVTFLDPTRGRWDMRCPKCFSRATVLIAGRLEFLS